MDAISIMRGLARNNAWANHRLLAACAQLSPDELHATRTSFFPTIMKTLNHILTVDWFYVDALVGGGRGRSAYAIEEPYAELAPLRAAQLASDRTLLAFVEGLAPAQLDAEVELDRRVGRLLDTAGAVLLHMLEHSIHHRGQVHAMLAGTRVAPPQLDEYFLREDLPVRRHELVELELEIG
ncbi:MAG TPA: DinB family protein [Kofleriaceae bacterium]|jgi:uncharacterized damage-inducible protein DinB